MDKSADYIKMCEKAFEIQGEMVGREIFGIIGISLNKEYVYYGRSIAYNAMESIWLPRQDQLQDMIKERNGDVLSQLQDIWIFTNLFKKEPVSFEQLWLEAVMYWKYNKTWNGTDWKKIRQALDN